MKSIFKDNPQLDLVYQTSDEKYFFLQSDAKAHAHTLKDKSVQKLVRPQNDDTSGEPKENSTEQEKTKTKK